MWFWKNNRQWSRILSPFGPKDSFGEGGAKALSGGRGEEIIQYLPLPPLEGDKQGAQVFCSKGRIVTRYLSDLANARNKKSPVQWSTELSFKIGHRPTLPPVTAVPLALAGLTSLFGMGRGGHRRYRHLKILKVASIWYQVSRLKTRPDTWYLHLDTSQIS